MENKCEENKFLKNKSNKELNRYLDDYVDAERSKFSSMFSVSRLLMEQFGLSDSQATTLAKGMCKAAVKSSIKEDQMRITLEIKDAEKYEEDQNGD